MNHYEMRQEARRQRLESLAERYELEGNARYKRAREMAQAIPFAQPILIGHHSEKRDRAYRGRIDSNYTKAFEATDKAKYYASRAASVGSGGISSDDPDAVTKLRAELVTLEALQAKMAACNKLIRKHAAAGPAAQVAALAAFGLSESQARELIQPDFAGRIGFAGYQLSNNSGNMRRIRGRIAELEARAAEAQARGGKGREWEGKAFRVTENLDINRVQVFFPGKPSAAVRSLLKSNGYRWSPTEGAWQRQAHGCLFDAIAGGYLATQIEGAP